MLVSFEAFLLPKSGNSTAEYEDAFWPTKSICRRERRKFCCAIADGATETSFSGLWAKLLVQAYCKHERPDDFLATLPALQIQWQGVVNSRPLPWYAERKAQSGAFAAFLGLQVIENLDDSEMCCKWQAFAVGDACLIHMRGHNLIASFPFSSPGQFGYHPYLIGSHPHSEDRLEAFAQTTFGEGRAGDTLYLMTDALAHWFLSRQEEGHYDDLQEIKTQHEFDNLVKRERLERDAKGYPTMRNDDMTLIRLVITR